MPKFTATFYLVEKIYESAEEEIEAKDEAEARETAKQLLEGGDLRWETIDGEALEFGVDEIKAD